jgi:GR25 family glycosyltransferase involved in LPS biosynthesis
MKIEGIDKIFCINLERREDRKKEAIREFSKKNLMPAFFEAIDGHKIGYSGKIKPGHIGCVLSHLNLYKQILEKEDGEVFMITEDDVVFSDDFIETYLAFRKNIPNDWVIFYFGGNHNNIKPDIISERIYRLKKTYTTHCYLVRKSKIQILIDEFSKKNIFDQEVDVHLSNIQRMYPCYGFIPSIAWQRESFSDIEMRNVNYDFLK